jgi:plasmid stabilization system protein ParE
MLSLAEWEATQAAIWYEERRPGAGNEFLAALEAALDRICANPGALPALEQYVGIRDVRRCRLERFPYIVFFVARPAEVVVLAVGHARRRPLYWLERLGRE